MLLVRVVPQAVGWSVVGCGEAQFFHSGGRAECAARRLAQALADTGASVELQISDRNGRLAGRLRVDYAGAAREFA